MQDEPIPQAERLILADLLKEIAAFGRRLREQRNLETLLPAKGEKQTELNGRKEQMNAL